MTQRSFAKGQVKVPTFVESRDREVAKYLRLIATRYLNGTSNIRDVREALALTLQDLDRAIAEKRISAFSAHD